jgi:hypothetical protein
MLTDPTRARVLALLREARSLIEQLGEEEREALHNLDSLIVDLLPDDGRNAERARAAALEKAHELQCLLQQLAEECGSGSPEEFAALSAAEALAYLEPDPGEDDEPPQRPRLRIVGG